MDGAPNPIKEKSNKGTTKSDTVSLLKFQKPSSREIVGCSNRTNKDGQTMHQSTQEGGCAKPETTVKNYKMSEKKKRNRKKSCTG